MHLHPNRLCEGRFSLILFIRPPSEHSPSNPLCSNRSDLVTASRSVCRGLALAVLGLVELVNSPNKCIVVRNESAHAPMIKSIRVTSTYADMN